MTEKNDNTIYFTVGTLTDALKKFPPDLPVLVSGYKAGYENFYEPDSIKVKHVPEQLYFKGEFQRAENDDEAAFDAVVLQRVLRDD